MGKVKIGVVEDEVIIADTICDTLVKLGYEVAEPAESYSEALEMIAAEQPDLLLLDIQLAGAKDGIDLAWKVKEDFNIPFIFLTANADAATVERAKKVQPPAYLVKPFIKDDLYAAIEICLYNFSKEKQEKESKGADDYVIKDALFIKENNCFHKVPFRDILYLENDHIYIKIHTLTKKTFMVRASMNDYLNNFEPSRFMRIHRGYAVNIEHVESIKDLNVVVKGIDVPISRTFREELLNRLKLG